MTEIVIVSLAYAAVVTAAFLFTVADFRAQRSEWSAEKRDLLDRLMSHDYREYRTLDPDRPKPAPIHAMTDEDEWRAEREARS